jgi:hypothetical protein
LLPFLCHLPDLLHDLIDIDQISSIAADQFHGLAAAGEANVLTHLAVAHFDGYELAAGFGQTPNLLLGEGEKSDWPE